MRDSGAFNAGLVVLVLSLLAALGPTVGVSPWLTSLLVVFSLGGLALDAARFSGRGGHLLAEALPGGRRRLGRIAVHEAGHLLQAEQDAMPVRRVLVGSLACLQAGVPSGGCTEFDPPASVRLPLDDLRRWSRVLQAGCCAERLIYGESIGGADDSRLLGRLWGLSGFDVATAQREQRQARREVDRQLRQRREELERRAEALLQQAPRLGRPLPGPDGSAAEAAPEAATPAPVPASAQHPPADP
ncbi:MAG: hypothetical protein VKK62_06185 [Synechococcaceae cyanobacterium]|nr:hypothetical protein [Synechococcaceae cyanobacterium]